MFCPAAVLLLEHEGVFAFSWLTIRVVSAVVRDRVDEEKA